LWRNDRKNSLQRVADCGKVNACEETNGVNVFCRFLVGAVSSKRGIYILPFGRKGELFLGLLLLIAFSSK